MGFGPAGCGVWPSRLWGLAQPALGVAQLAVGLAQQAVGLAQQAVGLTQQALGVAKPAVGLAMQVIGALKVVGYMVGWVAHVIFESPKSQLDHRKLRKLDMKNPSPRYFDLDYNFTWLRSCKNEFVRNLFSTSLLYSYILN